MYASVSLPTADPYTFTQHATIQVFRVRIPVTTAIVELVARTPDALAVCTNQITVAIRRRSGRSRSTSRSRCRSITRSTTALIDLTAYTHSGESTAIETILPVTLAAQVPVISSSSGLPNDRLLVPDLLMVKLFDPTIPMPAWAAARRS
jgi:hypothetical protein